MATHEKKDAPFDPRAPRAVCAAAHRLRHVEYSGGSEHNGQLYAAAYLGYLEPKDLDFFRQTYFGGRELPVHHISDGDFYLIIPRDPNATVRLLRNDMLTQTSSIFYEQPDGSPFVIGCNVSDIFPDVTVEITASDGEKVSFSPFISLEDGSVEVGERGLNITRISTAP